MKSAITPAHICGWAKSQAPIYRTKCFLRFDLNSLHWTWFKQVQTYRRRQGGNICFQFQIKIFVRRIRIWRIHYCFYSWIRFVFVSSRASEIHQFSC